MGGFELLYQRMHGEPDRSGRRGSQASGSAIKKSEGNWFTLSVILIQSLIAKLH